MTEYKYPIKADLLNFTLEDADKRVIVPAINYKSDQYHIDQQRRFLSMAEECINNFNGYWKQEDGTYKFTDEVISGSAETVSVDTEKKEDWKEQGKKRPGNPWGRAGKPKGE